MSELGHRGRRATRSWRTWMRPVLVAALTAGLVTTFRGADPAASPVAGDLDVTFDGDGIAVTEIASDIEVLDSAVQVLPGGAERILALDEARVWRFLPDGTLDTTFQDDGVRLHGATGTDLAIATGSADGAFVVGDRVGPAPRIHRFQQDGTPDVPTGASGNSTSVATVAEQVDGCSVEHSFTGFGDLALLPDGSTVLTGPGEIAGCEGSVVGIIGVQLDASLGVTGGHGAVLCAREGGETEMAEPRAMRTRPDGTVVVSVAIQCWGELDPVTVVTFPPGVATHEEFAHSSVQPTDGRRLPLLVGQSEGFAVAAESADGRAWNLLRWDGSGEFLGTTTLDLPGIASGTIGGLDPTDGGGYVVTGQVDGRADPDAIGVGRFGPEGAPIDLEVVSHDDGATELDIRASVRMPGDGSVRLVGQARPNVFGLDPGGRLAIARLDRTGVFDQTYGGDAGIVQHLGGLADVGETVAVRPDLRVLAGGAITALPGSEREPTGFVLQHQQAGPLDSAFATADRPGVEITTYAQPPSSVQLLRQPASVAPSTTSASRDVGSAGVLAQPGPPIEVDDESTFLDAFGNPDATHIVLTADIVGTACDGENWAERDSGSDLLVDGNGHALTLDCSETRLLDNGGEGALTLHRLTLTGGRAFVGGAVNSDHGHLTVDQTRFADNEASFGGGGIRGGNAGVTVIDSSFTDNRTTGGLGGGAIYVDFGGDVDVRSSSFSDNGVVSDGGAIRAGGGVTIADSAFTGNEVGGEGGDGYGGAVRAATVEVTSSSFVDNVARDSGGAIASDGDATVTDATFRDNVGDYAGALYAAGSATISDTVFAGNVAAFREGGALYVDVDLTVSDSSFTDNEAASSGGAVYVSEQVSVQRSSFVANTSGDVGGAIYGDGDVEVVASTIAQNSAASWAGAIWAELDLALTNTTLALNSSDGGGGGFEAGDVATLTYSTIVGNRGARQLIASTLVSEGSVFWNDRLTNTGGAGDPLENCDVDGTGSSHSWSNDASCGLSGPGDSQGGGDPFLDGLADNGGPTETMRPSEFSPLVDAIPTAACTEIGVTVDQRGEARATGPGCDIGAVEVFGPSVAIEVEGLALDSTGRSVIVGPADYGSDGGIHRLLADGRPDPSFNGGRPLLGNELLGDSAFDTVFHDVTIDSQGRIVVVGESAVEVDGIVDEVVVLRLLPDGVLDPRFGTGGIVRIGPDDPPTFWYASARGVTIDGLGRILLTGRSQIDVADFRDHLLVARLTADGARDASFGSSTELGPGTRISRSPDGYQQVGNDIITRGTQILVAGTRLASTQSSGSFGSESSEGFVRRLGVNGAPDAAFGADGYRFPFDAAPGEHSVATALAMDPLGNAVLTGGTLVSGPPPSSTPLPGDLALARVRPDGTMDPSFGSDGLVLTSVPGLRAGEVGTDVAIAPDGMIVVTGSVVDDRSERVITARYSPGLAQLHCTAVPSDLGDVRVGASTTSTIECTAEGGAVIVRSLGFASSSVTPGDYSLDAGTCSLATLDDGDRCTASMTFAPSETGPRTVDVGIEHLTVRGPASTVVPVRGTGFDPREEGPSRPTPPSPTPPSSSVPSLSLTPDEGPVETVVEATGTVFEVGVAAELRLGDLVLASVPGADVGADGDFTVTFAIPPGVPGGDHDVVACQRCGTASERTATAAFTVTPRVFVTPTLSRPGGVVTAFGDGFQADVPVRLAWDPGLGSAVVVPGADGEISTPFVIFRKDRLGTRELQAFISGSDEVAASTPFLAVPGSSQPGDFAIRR